MCINAHLLEGKTESSLLVFRQASEVIVEVCFQDVNGSSGVEAFVNIAFPVLVSDLEIFGLQM